MNTINKYTIIIIIIVVYSFHAVLSLSQMPFDKGGRGPWRFRSERKEIKDIKEREEEKELLPDIPLQPEENKFIFGVWLGRGVYSNEELDRAFKVVGNLGIKYFMIEFKWGDVEPENNKWEWNNEARLDVEHIISTAKKYNLSIIPYFTVLNPWGETKHLDFRKGECEGRPSKRGQVQAPKANEYAEYVFEVVRKLKENKVDVKYIKLDNEMSAFNDGYVSKSCFFNINAKQLKEAENAAYDKVKSVYPDVMISSTVFQFPGFSCTPRGPNCETFKERLNKFIKVYFEDNPKPKFDFLGLNEVFGGTGLWTKKERPNGTSYKYNFGSYFDAYDMWREILDKYGYSKAPIFNLESLANFNEGEQDIQLIQRAIFARINSDKNKVMGWIAAQFTGSKRYSEGINVGITDLTDGYVLREGYYAYYALMKTLARYPGYEGKVMGELNSSRPWVEKFSDSKGNVLYTAFVPYKSGNDRMQTVELNIGANREAKITKSNMEISDVKSKTDGNITLKLDQHPLFVEVSK